MPFSPSVLDAPVRGDAVLATLADANYVDQAKQLFSSAYFNGGWSGDYLLLSHGIDEAELSWFEGKGILVYRCPPLYDGRPGGMSPVLTSKFYLFKPEFKRWRTVVYCDADATIRASLDRLRGFKGFGAVRDTARWIESQIVSRQTAREHGTPSSQVRKLISELRRHHDTRRPAFCAGFFVFSTDLIDKGIFEGLKTTLDHYHVVSEYGDQLTFNLVFYDVWHALPEVYNIILAGEWNAWRLPPSELEAIVLHFASPQKPWDSQVAYSSAWQENRERADLLDLARIPVGEHWCEQRIEEYSAFLRSRERRWTFTREWIERQLHPSVRWLVRGVHSAFSRIRKIRTAACWAVRRRRTDSAA